MAIPEGWEEKSLADLCLAQGQYGANTPKHKFDPSMPRYIRITDISPGGRLLVDNAVSIPKATAQPYLLQDGDILLARSGNTVGKSYVHRNPGYDCAFAGYLVRFRADERLVLPGFLQHTLASPAYWEWVRQTQRIQAQPNINAGEYGRLPLLVPPLPEQRKIAAILSAVDETIEKTEAVIEQLQAVKKALMQELLRRGLPGRHTRFKKTEIGEVPEEWEVVPVSHAVSCCDYGLSVALCRDDTLTPVLRMGNLQEGEVDVSDLKYVDDQIPQKKGLYLEPGDILFNRTNSSALVGKVAIFRGAERPVTFASYLLRIKCHSDYVDPEWINQVLNTDENQQSLRNLATPGVSQANINRTKFLNFKVPIPPLSEQREMAGHLVLVDAKQAAEKVAKDNLLNVKTALMHVLLTGKLRVQPDTPDPTPQ